MQMYQYPGYQRFFSRCSAKDTSGKKEKIYEDKLCCLSREWRSCEKNLAFRAGHFEDSKQETTHEKPLAPKEMYQMNVI